MVEPTLILEAPRLFDGAGNFYDHGASLWIAGDRIQAIYDHEAPAPPPHTPRLVYEDATLLPGLMDSHVHLMYGTADRMNAPRSYHPVNEADSDALMLLRAVRNGYLHLLKAGVTTMRDAGARGRITFDLKEGLSADLFQGFPTVQASGRSITVTGGHFYFCGEEADGPEECRKSVRKLIKEGADFIKVMGSGGGTYITDNRRASYTVEELRAIVDESHRNGKTTTIHVIATESISNALDAGFDCVEHYEFVDMDDTRRYYPDLLQRMVDSGVWLSPTIQTGFRKMEQLQTLQQQRPLTSAEAESLRYFEWKQEGQLYATGELYARGARRFLMGTDAIQEFGDYALGLELMVNAGLSNEDALLAATTHCAEAFGILDEVGTLSPQKLADVTVVAGNPLQDMSHVGEVLQVVKAGYALPMDAMQLFPHGTGAATPPPRKRRPYPEIVRADALSKSI